MRWWEAVPAIILLTVLVVVVAGLYRKEFISELDVGGSWFASLWKSIPVVLLLVFLIALALSALFGTRTWRCRRTKRWLSLQRETFTCDLATSRRLREEFLDGTASVLFEVRARGSSGSGRLRVEVYLDRRSEVAYVAMHHRENGDAEWLPLAILTGAAYDNARAFRMPSSGSSTA